MMKIQTAALCLVPLALAACASDAPTTPICPQVAIVRELSHVSDYGGDTPDAKALVATASLLRVEGACHIDSDESAGDSVEVSYTLSMTARKGPRLGGDEIGFPFFVTVVAPDQKILTKEFMTAAFSFRGDSKDAERTEALRVAIPLTKGADVAGYQVLMGFQLTKDQIEATRKTEDERVEKAISRPD